MRTEKSPLVKRNRLYKTKNYQVKKLTARMKIYQTILDYMQ